MNEPEDITEDTPPMDPRVAEISRIAHAYQKAMASEYGGAAQLGHIHIEFARGIVDKDVSTLEHVANGLNPVAKRVFRKETGIHLPKSRKGSWRAILAWAGISQAQDAARIAQWTMEREREQVRQFLSQDPKCCQSTLDWIDLSIESGTIDRTRAIEQKIYWVDAAGDPVMEAPDLDKIRAYIQARSAHLQALKLLNESASAIELQQDFSATDFAADEDDVDEDGEDNESLAARPTGSAPVTHSRAMKEVAP